MGMDRIMCEVEVGQIWQNICDTDDSWYYRKLCKITKKKNTKYGVKVTYTFLGSNRTASRLVESLRRNYRFIKYANTPLYKVLNR